MASSRSKRANAGNKMASLLTSPEIEEDDFYKTLYGGFQEEEGDKDFEEPKEADDSAVSRRYLTCDFPLILDLNGLSLNFRLRGTTTAILTFPWTKMRSHKQTRRAQVLWVFRNRYGRIPNVLDSRSVSDGTSAEQGKLKRPKKDEAEEAENDKSDEEPKTKRDKVEDAKETEATDT